MVQFSEDGFEGFLRGFDGGVESLGDEALGEGSSRGLHRVRLLHHPRIEHSSFAGLRTISTGLRQNKIPLKRLSTWIGQSATSHTRFTTNAIGFIDTWYSGGRQISGSFT